MTPDDDDALTWAGDEDAAPARPASPVRPRRPVGSVGGDGSGDGDGFGVGDGFGDRDSRFSDGGDDGGDGADVSDGGASAAPVTGAPMTEAPAGQTGPVELVLLGLLAGVFALYTVRWALAIGPLLAAFRPADPFGASLFALGLVLASAAPALWFASSFWFTRSRPRRQRMVALVIGAVLLVPWPSLVGVQG